MVCFAIRDQKVEVEMVLRFYGNCLLPPEEVIERSRVCGHRA